MIPKGISRLRGQTARPCLTLGWWETRTQSLWPAKTPPVGNCLIDMHIPPGGGPPPHRHDFEEMFSVSEGEIDATFRGKKTIIRAGETINIPANAPHQFQNKSGQPARLLCLCSPAGQEEFFKEVGVPVAARTTPPPPLDEEAEAAFIAKVKTLAPKYRTELLPPQAGTLG
jgi:quercetin dioxygenase-like cupin family protein